ncbi:hypothetical protein EJB05_36744, partial [Eragrostis curvula]
MERIDCKIKPGPVRVGFKIAQGHPNLASMQAPPIKFIDLLGTNQGVVDDSVGWLKSILAHFVDKLA